MPKKALDDYITVDQRLREFYAKYPQGWIESEIVHDDGERVIIKAYVHTGEGTGRCSTGHAEEVRGDGFINRTSAVENCETSAWGRALAALGLAVHQGVASREEIEIAEAKREDGRVVKREITKEDIARVEKDVAEMREAMPDELREGLDKLAIEEQIREMRAGMETTTQVPGGKEKVVSTFPGSVVQPHPEQRTLDDLSDDELASATGGRVTADPPKPTVALATPKQRNLIAGRAKRAGLGEGDLRAVLRAITGESTLDRVPKLEVDNVLAALDEAAKTMEGE